MFSVGTLPLVALDRGVDRGGPVTVGWLGRAVVLGEVARVVGALSDDRAVEPVPAGDTDAAAVGGTTDPAVDDGTDARGSG